MPIKIRSDHLKPAHHSPLSRPFKPRFLPEPYSLCSPAGEAAFPIFLLSCLPIFATRSVQCSTFFPFAQGLDPPASLCDFSAAACLSVKLYAIASKRARAGLMYAGQGFDIDSAFPYIRVCYIHPVLIARSFQFWYKFFPANHSPLTCQKLVKPRVKLMQLR